VADWVTISSLATAGGTLVLAVSTFASVRSANRAARAAERSLLAGLRPLLLPSRLQDPEQKVGFADQKWLVVPGGGAAAQVGEDAIYLALSLRNVGTGLGVLHGWYFHPGRELGSAGGDPPPLTDFHRLSRDLYIPAGDFGFWQGAFRDPEAPEFAAARTPIEARESVTVDLLYGDQDGGQRVITRFIMNPRAEDGWLGTVSRHWNVDRDDPR
jgi:hypothetical protein